MPPKRQQEVSTNSSLAELFSNLSLAASSNDYDKVLEIADQVLKSSPLDSLAAKEKITALIKLDRYKEALTFLTETTFLKDEETVLERGFCLYKVGNCAEAEEVLKTASGRTADHIRAQNAYRMEDFETAMKLYTNLQKSLGQIDHESEDIASNYSAARAQSTWTSGAESSESKMSQEGWEVQFNNAYGLIALGKLDEAETALQNAEKLCSRSGLSGEELKAEQGIILTQLAYIKQLRGNKEGALKLYSDVQNQECVDAATRAIALNNQLSLEQPQNPFETHRLHSEAIKSFLSSKPFAAQSRLFSINSLLISSQAYKSVNSGIKTHREQYPLDFSASLIGIQKHLPPVTDAGFLKKLSAVFHRDETDVAAALLLIQYQWKEGSTQLAASTLEKLLHALKEKLDIKYAPGLVGLAAVLLPKVEREDKATSLMMEAKEYWSNKKNAGIHLSALTSYAALARLNQLLTLQSSPAHTQELEAMIKEQESYLKDHPNDISTRAVLAALYASTSSDSGNANQHICHLPPTSQFTKSIDVAQLESQGIPSTAVNVTKKPVNKSRPRKRRLRGNNTIDFSKEADPERWLPLRERSYYKPAKNKKRRTGGGATQGGAMEAENMSRTGSELVERKVDPSGGKKKKKNRK